MKCSNLDGPYQGSAEAPPKQRVGAKVLGGFENLANETCRPQKAVFFFIIIVIILLFFKFRDEQNG